MSKQLHLRVVREPAPLVAGTSERKLKKNIATERKPQTVAMWHYQDSIMRHISFWEVYLPRVAKYTSQDKVYGWHINS